MLRLTHDLERNGPGSISSNLYWLRDGELATLEATAEGEQIVFNPTPEFTDLLNELA
jgi:hypothetical protein